MAGTLARHRGLRCFRPRGRIAPDNARSLRRSGFHGRIVEAKPTFSPLSRSRGTRLNFRIADQPPSGPTPRQTAILLIMFSFHEQFAATGNIRGVRF